MRTINTPTQRCDPAKPGLHGVRLNYFVSAREDTITVIETRTICNSATSRSFPVRIEDHESFVFPDDLHPTTIAMLDGIARRFMRLAQYGTDREP